MDSTEKSAGTSLVEVMVAMTIAVMVLSMLAQGWRSMVVATARSQQSSLRWRLLESCVAQLAADRSQRGPGPLRRRWLTVHADAGVIERGFEWANLRIVHRWTRGDAGGLWTWTREVREGSEVSPQILLRGFRVDLFPSAFHQDREREEFHVLSEVSRVRGVGIDWLRLPEDLAPAVVRGAWLLGPGEEPVRLRVHEYLGRALAVDEFPDGFSFDGESGNAGDPVEVLLEVKVVRVRVSLGFDGEWVSVHL